MSSASEHIAGWQAAGLLDPETADRLRAADANEPEPEPAVASAGSASRMFGPSVTVAEVFGYLGGGFLVAAWSAFMGTTAASTDDPEMMIGILGLLAAGVLTAVALRLRMGDERQSRAAGVVLLVGLGFVSGATYAFLSGGAVEWPQAGVIVSAVVLLIAIVYRMLHPSALTQVGILASMTALAAAVLVWLQETLFPVDYSDVTGIATQTGPDPILLVVASAAWWLALAVVIGLLGLAESRRIGNPADPTAASRAAITRFWAGLVAVVGLASSVSRSAPTANGDFARVLEPIIGDIALVILSAVLVERAFRRDATSYIYAAALGLMVALTDFNLSYLADSTAAGLTVEGLILLGVGLGADRLRKRVGRAGAGGSPAEPAEPAPAVPDPAPLPEPSVPAPETT